MSNSSRFRSSSNGHDNQKRIPRVIPAESTEFEPESEEEQNDINELPFSSKWDKCDALFRQLEQHFNDNHTNIYHQKLNALEKFKKAKNMDPMFRATIKEVENDRDRRLKLVELKRQRRIQQTERLFDAQEQELEREFEAAKGNLKIAWESLYPPNARKRRRKRYPRSIKELVARVGPSWNFSTNNDDNDDNVEEIESIADRKNRLYRIINKRDEDEIKQNLEQFYKSPDDTPEQQLENSTSSIPTKSTRKSAIRRSKSRSFSPSASFH